MRARHAFIFAFTTYRLRNEGKSMDKNNTKKYRIFGINVIDLLVILVIIAAVLLVAYKFLGLGKDNSLQNVEIVFKADEVSDFVIDKLKEGCRLYDDEESIDLGTCISFETGPSESYGTNLEGEFVLSSKPYCQSLYLNGKVKAKMGANGVIVGGHEYCIGDFIILRAGDAKLYISVYDIVPETASGTNK